jgi:hypothetical protein
MMLYRSAESGDLIAQPMVLREMLQDLVIVFTESAQLVERW